MLRNRSKTAPGGNGSVPHHDEYGPDQPTMADIYRLFDERFDKELNRMKSHTISKIKSWMDLWRTGKRQTAFSRP